jgi:hypothetical protein
MKKAISIAASCALVTACAAADRKASAPAQTASPPPPSYSQPSTPAGAGYPQQSPMMPPPEPGQAPSRTVQMQTASRDIESSVRELDVAAGDCSNACRALASMDRATGTLCQLAREGDEVRRCEDAKKKVYSARDRVRTTCGGCPGGPSVDRNDPIPSTR